MASDVVSVRLWLRQIKVTGVLVDVPGELVVGVRSTVTRPVCPHWGSKRGRIHDRRGKRVRDLEVSGRPTVMVWDRRPMVCDGCGRRFLEDHPAFEGRLTARVARRVVADARDMSVSAVARRHRVGWHVVMALVIAYTGLVGDHRRRRRCRVLLVDETSIRKRHRYVTVLVNGGTGGGARHGSPPQRGGPQRLSGCSGPQVVQRRQGRRLRRLQVVRSGDRQAARPRPPCAGPLPRHQMVRDGSRPASPRCAARSSAARRSQSPRSTPQCSGPDSCSCADPTPSTTQSANASTPSSRPTLGSKQPGTRSASCTSSISRRTPKAPQQRPHRRHQQPPPSPATPSPRLHQLRQLRSPRHPRHLT